MGRATPSPPFPGWSQSLDKRSKVFQILFQSDHNKSWCRVSLARGVPLWLNNSKILSFLWTFRNTLDPWLWDQNWRDYSCLFSIVTFNSRFLTFMPLFQTHLYVVPFLFVPFFHQTILLSQLCPTPFPHSTPGLFPSPTVMNPQGPQEFSIFLPETLRISLPTSLQ